MRACSHFIRATTHQRLNTVPIYRDDARAKRVPTIPRGVADEEPLYHRIKCLMFFYGAEGGGLLIEVKLYSARRAIAVFFNQNLRNGPTSKIELYFNEQ